MQAWAPVSSEAKEIETGKYRGTLQLTMAGDWIVLVHITLPDGQKLQRQIEDQWGEVMDLSANSASRSTAAVATRAYAYFKFRCCC